MKQDFIELQPAMNQLFLRFEAQRLWSLTVNCLVQLTDSAKFDLSALSQTQDTQLKQVFCDEAEIIIFRAISTHRQAHHYLFPNGLFELRNFACEYGLFQQSIETKTELVVKSTLESAQSFKLIIHPSPTPTTSNDRPRWDAELTVQLLDEKLRISKLRLATRE